MRRSVRVMVAAVTMAILMAGCGGNESVPYQLPRETAAQPVRIMRLDSILSAFGRMDSAQQAAVLARDNDVLYKYAAFVNSDMVFGGYDIDRDALLSLSTSNVVTMFQPEVDKEYADITGEETAIGNIVAAARHAGLRVPANRFATAVWSDRHPLMIASNDATTDTAATVFIALNHYLGSESNAYAGWPEYLRKNKNRNAIVADVAHLLITAAYPYQGEATADDVLSQLLYEGSVAVIKRGLTQGTGVTHQALLGLTETEFNDVMEHRQYMMDRLISSGMLYSKDGAVKSNLFDGMQPATTLISPDAPARAVVAVGMDIVDKYLALHPDTPAAYLLSPNFYGNGVDVLRSIQNGER